MHNIQVFLDWYADVTVVMYSLYVIMYMYSGILVLAISTLLSGTTSKVKPCIKDRFGSSVCNAPYSMTATGMWYNWEYLPCMCMHRGC